jgi:hypothetical protein
MLDALLVTLFGRFWKLYEVNSFLLNTFLSYDVL